MLPVIAIWWPFGIVMLVLHSCLVGSAGSVELSVVLCGDAYITELNQEWRGKAAATDVLSFPATDWDDLIPDAPLALGDVIISLDTAHRQATEQGWAHTA